LTARHRKPSLRGRFLTFEGIDGCGKTTQAQMLAGRLRGAGLPVLETREPGGTAIGEQVRAVLLRGDNSEMTPQCELLLYLADRVQHLAQVIRPALAEGTVVLCDRYHDATVAYQQHGRGLALEGLRDFLAAEVHATAPHLTFWLDLPVEAAQARIARRNDGPHPPGAPPFRGDESRLDSAAAAFHERVRNGYAAIRAAEPERVLRIEAARAPGHIAAEIWKQLEARYDVL
jgi:dTMP kinase